MKYFHIAILSLFSFNSFSMDLSDVVKQCPDQVALLSELNDRIEDLESDSVSNVFFAGMRGYIYESENCSDVEFGLNKLSRGLDEL